MSAMTPKQASVELSKLTRQVGDGFNVSISVMIGSGAPLRGSVFRTSGRYETLVEAHADDFAPLLERIAALWAEHQTTERARRIRDMALAIIRITDETGACSASALRVEGFAQTEVAALADEAATKANGMAANGPFHVVHQASNDTATA